MLRQCSGGHGGRLLLAQGRRRHSRRERSRRSRSGNTFNIGNKTYRWSSLNTVGPDLRDLNEGDEVKIRYSTTHSGKNTVQRITLVKPAAAAAAAPTSAAQTGFGRPPGQPGAPELAAVQGQLSGLDVQPARPDQRVERQGPGARLELFDRRRFGTKRRRSSTMASCSSPPRTTMIALNATNGDLLWEYQRELPEGFGALHNTKRGVALYGDKVYMTGQDAVLVALNAETGEVVWESGRIADWQRGTT